MNKYIKEVIDVLGYNVLDGEDKKVLKIASGTTIDKMFGYHVDETEGIKLGFNLWHKDEEVDDPLVIDDVVTIQSDKMGDDLYLSCYKAYGGKQTIFELRRNSPDYNIGDQIFKVVLTDRSESYQTWVFAIHLWCNQGVILIEQDIDRCGYEVFEKSKRIKRESCTTDNYMSLLMAAVIGKLKGTPDYKNIMECMRIISPAIRLFTDDHIEKWKEKVSKYIAMWTENRENSAEYCDFLEAQGPSEELDLRQVELARYSSELAIYKRVLKILEAREQDNGHQKKKVEGSN